MAALHDKPEVITVLLTASAINLNATCKSGPRAGDSAILVAASNGFSEIVKLLAADTRTLPNLSNTRGETALILSSIWCLSAISDVAKMPSIEPNLKDNHQRSALYYAIARLTRFTPPNALPAHIAALLAMPGIEVNTLNRKEWSLLMVAVAKGNLPTVRALLEAGADPCYRISNGFTPERIAFYAEQVEIKRLIDSYAEKKPAQRIATPLAKRLSIFAKVGEDNHNHVSEACVFTLH